MRGIVREDESGATVLVSCSPDVARPLAELLDGEYPQPKVAEGRSPISRYSSFVARPGSAVTLITADGFSAGRGALGDGPIATTEDAELAQRLVEMLNRVDPALKARSWWGWF